MTTAFKKTLYNALAFNVAWFFCVLGGSKVAIVVTILVLAAHFYFISNNSREISLVILVVALGIVMDSVLIRAGVLISANGSSWPPVWLLCLWAMFATLLSHSMKWFQSHLPVAFLLGGISGTLSYAAGTRLTDFALREPLWTSLPVIALCWCVTFPVCLMLAKKLMQVPQGG